MNEKLSNISAILKELLKYQTIEENKGEFEKIFSYIKSIIPNNLNITEYDFANKKAMVIANTDSKKLDIVFCTHIDVVPAENYDFEETEDLIKGRGTFDMKGSVAVCLELFKNLETTKKVALFITSDEEITGNCAKQLLTIYTPAFAIVPDGGKDYQLIIEEKGQLQLKVSLKTISAHASQPYNGENAISSLYKMYEELLKKYPQPKSAKEYKTSINLSMLEGGEALNSVASTATMYLDIRYTSDVKPEKVIQDLKEINKNIEISIIHLGNLFQANKNDKNIKKYLAISKEVLKRDIEITASEATSDAIYFSEKNIPTVLTNPVGNYQHSPKEYVEKESLYNLYVIWDKLLKGETK